MKLEVQTGEILGLQNLATYKFRNLRNFAGYQFSQPAHLDSPVSPDCFLTRWFNTSLPLCNFDSLAHFCNFLLMSLYKLNHACNQINFLSFNQSVKHKASSSLLLVIFSSSPFTFLHFLGCQTPLDDDKSRDAWLIPHDP